MRNVLPLIVIIFAVVALIIVVGFIIGTVAHNIKSESEEEVIEQQVVREEVVEPLLPVFEELFSLQIMDLGSAKAIMAEMPYPSKEVKEQLMREVNAFPF